LGLGSDGTEWEYERIGSDQQKMNVARELQELRGRLAQVEQWKARHERIEHELAKVWAEAGGDLPPPAHEEKGRYTEKPLAEVDGSSALASS
jgi:ATP-binding cassette subfamily D (ALD) long-chain fatty acid import protein